ncbi:hypothetical protein LJB63_27960, partial [[Eubacterium] rectale]|nr:hypothetical protein [Agathobacter rectalis]
LSLPGGFRFLFFQQAGGGSLGGVYFILPLLPSFPPHLMRLLLDGSQLPLAFLTHFLSFFNPPASFFQNVLVGL